MMAAMPGDDSEAGDAVSTSMETEDLELRIEKALPEQAMSDDVSWDVGLPGDAPEPRHAELQSPPGASEAWNASPANGDELGPPPGEPPKRSEPAAAGPLPRDDPGGRDLWDEAMTGSADEAMEYRSVARHFAEFSGMAKIVAQAPDPEEAPPGVELTPRPRHWEGGRRAPVDPEVDTSALIREFSGFGLEGKRDPKKDDPPVPSPPPPRMKAPSPPSKKPQQKGRGFFGRKRR
jgi:hypothetical protein